ncbi:MAG TPA: response regulator [Pyrinomonadaceae bacterium]|jgi:CheY-like chemotaxis protein|nr:response regulator [Pyrinomonadaceae bacterium]
MSSEESEQPLVLVVDDYDDIRVMLRKALQAKGCRVIEARDGREAVETALRERPALILMDVWMPKQTGVAAVKEIREDPAMSDVPIIALTAYEAVDLHIKAIQAGCNQYLLKPIDLEQLQGLVDRYLPAGVD